MLEDRNRKGKVRQNTSFVLKLELPVTTQGFLYTCIDSAHGHMYVNKFFLIFSLKKTEENGALLAMTHPTEVST